MFLSCPEAFGHTVHEAAHPPPEGPFKAFLLEPFLLANAGSFVPPELGERDLLPLEKTEASFPCLGGAYACLLLLLLRFLAGLFLQLLVLDTKHLILHAEFLVVELRIEVHVVAMGGHVCFVPYIYILKSFQFYYKT